MSVEGIPLGARPPHCKPWVIHSRIVNHARKVGRRVSTVSAAPARLTSKPRRMIKSTLAVAGALLVIVAIPSMVGPAAGATPTTAATPAAVPASLRSELENYLNTYRGVEHISAVSLAVTFRGRRPGINLAVGNTLYGGGPTISPYALWQIGSNTKAFTSVLVLQFAG